MEVILREEIEKLGNRGDIVNVADGYARNYLLPKKLAVPATEANKKIIEQERQAYLRREAKLASEAEELARMLAGVTVTIAQKAGEMDQLFGSVTAKDIAEALEQQNFQIDRRSTSAFCVRCWQGRKKPSTPSRHSSPKPAPSLSRI
jgi:large subunit ribosomal protein L9